MDKTYALPKMDSASPHKEAVVVSVNKELFMKSPLKKSLPPPKAGNLPQAGRIKGIVLIALTHVIYIPLYPPSKGLLHIRF